MRIQAWTNPEWNARAIAIRLLQEAGRELSGADPKNGTSGATGVENPVGRGDV